MVVQSGFLIYSLIDWSSHFLSMGFDGMAAYYVILDTSRGPFINEIGMSAYSCDWREL